MVLFQTAADKKRFLPLLLLADPCEAMIDRYLEAGDMHMLAVGGAVICEAVVLPLSDTTCELKNLATDPQFQGQGHATHLLNALFRFYAARYAVMLVGTTETGAAFYARFGFTPSHRVVGFFTDITPNPSWKTACLAETCSISKNRCAESRQRRRKNSERH